VSDGVLHRLFEVGIGLFLLWCAIDGVRTGSSQTIYQRVTREHDPLQFWIYVTVGFLGGVFLLVIAAFPFVKRF
jgi:hypothetical protein